MGLLSLNLPVIGQSSATEDQKVRDALSTLQTDYNGNVTDANISAAAGIQESKFANGLNGLARGSFSAYRNTALSLGTTAGVVFDTEEWDISGWYDTTLGRFTPLVAGYYRLSWLVTPSAALTADVFWSTHLEKNNARLKDGSTNFQRGTAAAVNSGGSALVQANGSTDFFAVTLFHNVGVAQAVFANAALTYFQGELIGRS